MKALYRLYLGSTAGERLAAILVVLGLALKTSLVFGLSDSSNSFQIMVIAFTSLGVVCVFMIVLGGGGHIVIWRNLLDRFLPLLTWGLVLGLLIATSDLT